MESKVTISDLINERSVIMADTFSVLKRFLRSVATNFNVKNERSLKALDAGIQSILLAILDKFGNI